MAVTNLYTGWRLTKAAGFTASVSTLKWLPVLLLMSFYLLPAAAFIHYLTGGEPYLPSYPHFLIYWFWFGFIFSFQLLTLAIILDLLKTVLNFTTKISDERLYSIYSKLLLAGAVILLSYTGIKARYDTTQIDIEYTNVELADIPNAFEGFRIVHISDLQADEFTGRQNIANYIQKVNKLRPDLVIFTGDLISYGTDFIEMAARELSEVEADYGLYAVIGDHDYWAGVSNIKSAYQKYHINLLQNENTVISVKGDSLLLTGITEVYDEQINSDSLRALASAYEDIPFEIMAVHQANTDVIKIAQNYNYEILLGGHTHGGQIRVPFMFMHFSAPAMETDYLSGSFWLNSLLLNVNNGLGFTLAPVRYDAQPSISVLSF